jgi:hypothetical protein
MTDSKVKSNTEIPFDATEVTFGDFLLQIGRNHRLT